MKSPIADMSVSEVITLKSTFLGCTKKLSNFPFIIKSDKSNVLLNKTCANPNILAANPQSNITSFKVYPPYFVSYTKKYYPL